MLYLVATPIGNLGDMTFRGIETLKNVDLIVCEDTRHSKKLLMHFDIKKPLDSFHAFSDQKKLDKLLGLLAQGKNIALISDAGTPCISDPGYILVKKCIENNISVVPIPGASAFLTALMGSSFPINRFYYYGFLPAKKGRETLFKEFASNKSTIVFYESPYRILRTLESLSKSMPEREIVLARELTKIYEEFIRGTSEEVFQKMKNHKKIQGEFVVIISAI